MSAEIRPNALCMDLSKNPLPFSIRRMSQGICPRDSATLFLANLRQISVVRSVGPNPTVRDSPTFSMHLDGTAGPHLGPRWPYLAYHPLPHGRERFHLGISLPFLHVGSKAHLRVLVYCPIIPGPAGSMAQATSYSSIHSTSPHRSITTIRRLLCIGLQAPCFL